MNVVEVPLSLSRHAFGPREVARAGHLWRLCQDAAIEGSTRLGWHPRRYQEIGGAFIVRGMTVVHHREVAFGVPVSGRTWVSTFQRGMMTHRQIRVLAEGEPLLSATQRWVYVAMPEMKPGRAPAELMASFSPGMPEGEVDVVLPEVTDPAEGEEHVFSFELWHGWMDPLAHANHPAYVDWADEALHRLLAGSGIDPQSLVAVAETVTYRSGAVAPEKVTLRTRRVGTIGPTTVFRHRVEGGDGRELAEVITHRRLAGDDDRLSRS